MNITRLTLWHMPLTSHLAYNMADGKICDTVTTSVLRLEADNGQAGWGEVCPIPHYLPAYAGGVAPALAELAPVIFARDGSALGAEAMMRAADRHLIGHVYAKSALDIALWDLTAQVAGLPLHRLLGGLQTPRLPLYHSISCIDPDEMRRIAVEETARGITQLRVKLGADRDNEADIARLRLVREAVPAATLVYGDWNCGASRLDATRVGRAVAGLDVMLEQPCATLEDCAAVRDATGLAMKIDENAHDTASLLHAWRLGCMDAVALAVEIRRHQRDAPGPRPVPDARRENVHRGYLGLRRDNRGGAASGRRDARTRDHEQLRSVGLCRARLDPKAPVREGGHIAPPQGPGLGVSPDPEMLGAPILDLTG